MRTLDYIKLSHFLGLAPLPPLYSVSMARKWAKDRMCSLAPPLFSSGISLCTPIRPSFPKFSVMHTQEL